MKVLFTSGRELEYVRNTVITNALKRYYHLITINDNSKNIILRYFKIYIKILRAKRDYKLTVVGFYGTPFMIFAQKLFKTKILFDAFVSTYDTLCFDRKIIKPNSILGRIIFLLDKKSLDNAHHILVDTNENKKYLHDTFDIPNKKITTVFVSCDEYLFKSSQTKTNKIIFFYSTYQPLHGTLNIIEAAKIIENFSDYSFHIYGRGQEFDRCLRLSNEYLLKNVIFFDYISYNYLPNKISESSICLAGPFGDSPKARRVITGKTFQFLFMKKPIIVTNTSANKELLKPGFDAEFCEIGDPNSLAKSILKLINNEEYRMNIAQNGYNTYMIKASNVMINSQIKNLINRI